MDAAATAEPLDERAWRLRNEECLALGLAWLRRTLEDHVGGLRASRPPRAGDGALSDLEADWLLRDPPMAPSGEACEEARRAYDGARTALRQAGLPESHAARIGRTTAWIRAHYAEPLRVADLAALARMSAASFHRHFKAVTTMTPVQFQKQVRLHEARRLLLGAGDVAGVGYAIGYESPSQFSRDYRRLFGAPPGRDGAAIRARLAPEPALP